MFQRLIATAVLAAVLPFPAVAQTAPGQAGDCEAAHQQCVAQQPTMCNQSASDVREQCLQNCSKWLASCKSTRTAQDAALAEVQRTGGPKPGQCPAGWMLEQRRVDAFGTFKCFATGSERTLPDNFKCPPGLVIKKGIDAVFCDKPRP